MAQITRDGYIARNDGMRDWYLNHDKFGINAFFENASAVLYYEDGKYVVESKCGETTFDTTLEEVLLRYKHLDGYMAIEATPYSQPILQMLLTSHCIEEIHVFWIPVDLVHGLAFPISELEFGWRLKHSEPVKADTRVTYSVYVGND